MQPNHTERRTDRPLVLCVNNVCGLCQESRGRIFCALASSSSRMIALEIIDAQVRVTREGHLLEKQPRQLHLE